MSKKAKYALKALIVLADEYGKGPVLISEICKREDLPKKFLEAILLELRKSGLVQSRKGKGGGYSLRLNPKDITMANIIRLTDGPIAPMSCVSINYYAKCDDCLDEKTCRLRKLMQELRDAKLRVLEGMNLADFPRSEEILVEL